MSENSQSNERSELRQAVHELTVLNELATTLSTLEPVDVIVNKIIHKCIKHLQVEQGDILLLDVLDKHKPFHTFIRQQDSEIKSTHLTINERLSGWIIEHKKPLIINDNKSFKNFGEDFSPDFRTLLATPMILQGELTGILAVFNKRHDNEFTEADQRLLTIIASQAAQFIENSRLYEEEKKLISLKREMKLASEIQESLLPESSPAIDGFDIYAESIPAKEVGGDYYDYRKLPDEKFVFCIADITGKGIPAAMLMSNLQATLRGQLKYSCQLTEIVSRTNDLLTENTKPDMFATLFIGILDPSNSEVTYCNAGHDIPILLSKDNTITKLKTGGMLIGFCQNVHYESDSVSMHSGDILVLFTDGVTEAMNEDEQEFGHDRLMDAIIRSKTLSAKETVEVIVKEVKKHSQMVPQSDDITILIIKKI